MDPVTVAAAGTAASGLIQGLLSMETEKRKLKLQKGQFDIQQRENRLAQEVGMMQQQAAAPVQQGQAQAQTYQNLIQALGGTR